MLEAHVKIAPPPDGSHDTMFDTACDFLAPDLRPIPPQVTHPLMDPSWKRGREAVAVLV